MFQTEKEAIYWIENIKRKEKRKDLSRMRECLKRLGNPQNSYESIHIAGTNGKGATAYMTSKILIEAGHTVGRFTSPYIVCFNERIVVNDNYIDSDSLVTLTNQVKEIVDKYNEEFDDIVPFFEVVTLIGFLYFKQMKCDYAVIECGLGGLMDATNVIDSKLSIITSIGYDHMSVLGNTLEEIAKQKLGIVKNGSHLITGVNKSLYPLFDKECLIKGASIQKISYEDILIKSNLEGTDFYYMDNHYHIPLLGRFEALNACMAIEAVKYLFDIDSYLINKAFRNLVWPGRLELVSKHPTILIDGGHNSSAIDELKEAVERLMPRKKLDIIYTGLKDKETSKVITILEPISNEFIITTLNDPRAKDPYLMQSEVDFNNIKVITNFEEALQYEKNKLKEDDALLITGSLHFISYVRTFFKK